MGDFVDYTPEKEPGSGFTTTVARVESIHSKWDEMFGEKQEELAEGVKVKKSPAQKTGTKEPKQINSQNLSLLGSLSRKVRYVKTLFVNISLFSKAGRKTTNASGA